MPKAAQKMRRRKAVRKPLPPKMPLHPDGKCRVFFRLLEPMSRWRNPQPLYVLTPKARGRK